MSEFQIIGLLFGALMGFAAGRVVSSPNFVYLGGPYPISDYDEGLARLLVQGVTTGLGASIGFLGISAFL